MKSEWLPRAAPISFQPTLTDTLQVAKQELAIAVAQMHAVAFLNVLSFIVYRYKIKSPHVSQRRDKKRTIV